MTADPALAHLLAADAVLAPVIGAARPLAPTAHPDLYRALLDAIISQQLSVKAAATISQRFRALFPDRYPTPSAVLGLPDEALRAVGLSRQKSGYLRAVATFQLAGQLEHARLHTLADEALIGHLTQIKGVGRWTAQMLLLFALARPDVFPELDLGIQQAMRRLYPALADLSGKPLLAAMAVLAERWRPYRSTASRLLWQSLANNPKTPQ